MTYPPGYEHIYSLCVSLSPTNFSVGSSKLEKKSCVQWKCRTNLYFLFHCVSGLFQKPPPPSFHGVQQHQAPPIYKSINSRFFTHFTGAGIFVFLEPLLLVATENSVSYKPYKLYMLQLRSAKNYRDLRMHLSLFPQNRMHLYLFNDGFCVCSLYFTHHSQFGLRQQNGKKGYYLYWESHTRRLSELCVNRCQILKRIKYVFLTGESSFPLSILCSPL